VIRYDLYDRASPSLVLIVPGFWRDRRHPAMLRMAGFIHQQGYRVAVMDVRGHGESGGIYGFNLHEHLDVEAVCRDLIRRVPIESITLAGLSYGGAIAISTAARHDLPIGSLLLISPVADFAMLSPRLNFLTLHRHIAFRQAFRRPRFDWRMRRSAKLRAIEDVRDVHVPLSLIHVKDDWLVAHTHSQKLFENANEPKELHVLDVKGNFHADRIFSVAGPLIEPLMLGFLEKYTPR